MVFFAIGTADFHQAEVYASSNPSFAAEDQLLEDAAFTRATLGWRTLPCPAFTGWSLRSYTGRREGVEFWSGWRLNSQIFQSDGTRTWL